MRHIIPFVGSVAIAAALFTACSTDDSVSGGGAKDASAGDGSSSLDGSVTAHDAGTRGKDAGTAADATSDATSAGDASADAAMDDAATDDGGDDGGDDADIDASFDGSPPGDAGVDPTFTNVYGIIINGTCNGCHAGAFASGKLNMGSQALAYANLVGVTSAGPACGPKAETRVLPNDHAKSLIWNKVNGTNDCGSRMPLGGTPLSQEKIDLIAEWIDNGAMND